MHAIRFDQVSKQFRTRHNRSFREWFVSLGPTPPRPDGPDQFWALRNISFEIQPGESVGLIGHNGAGKSTALKLIGRLMTPSQGRLEIHGRVSALLELGAGFHPELSGRDNVFLSGALLGLSRRDMAARFDAIVDFSEIEEFIDMPVKHYSSGMFARLAFAVSANVEPEILLVDEALAVGDYNFQQKCLTRIDELKSSGVTIVLVSHAHDTIRTHCRRVLWFDHGKLMADGVGETEIARYLDHTAGVAAEKRLSAVAEPEVKRQWGNGEVELFDVQILDESRRPRSVFRTGEAMVLTIAYRVRSEIRKPVFGMGIHRQDGLHITGPNTNLAGLDLSSLRGSGSITYRIPRLTLLDGDYLISISAHHPDGITMYDYHDRLYPFRVDNQGSGFRERFGLMSMLGDWQVEPDSPQTDA